MDSSRDDGPSDERPTDGDERDPAGSRRSPDDGGGNAETGDSTGAHERDRSQPESASDLRADSDARSDGGGREKETGPLAVVRRFRDSDNEAVVFVREMLSSGAIVLAIGLLLFAVSGVWPPMVAIESGSMDPNMQKGDLVFIMESGRLPPEAAHGDTGVVPYQAGAEAGYEKFNAPGDVIVYQPDGKEYTTPIIHRARFWVDEGENWYDEADKDYISAENCEELANCPAPNSGFITKGDANPYYDQSNMMDISGPVKPNWIRGTAEVRVPWLGWVRLQFSGAAYLSPGAAPTPVSV